VSEPFDHDEKWITVPADHVVVAKAGERAHMLPLFRHRQQAAE
jgi:predicted glutamine amidotransferase